MVLLTILCPKTNDWKKSTTCHQHSTFQTSPYNHLTGEVYGAQRPYVVTSNHGYGVPEVGLSQFKSGLQSHCDMGQDLMRPVPLASFKRHAAAVSVRAEFRRKGHSIHFADQTSRLSKHPAEDRTIAAAFVVVQWFFTTQTSPPCQHCWGSTR